MWRTIHPDKVAAAEYLQKHHLEAKLSEAMAAVLRERLSRGRHSQDDIPDCARRRNRERSSGHMQRGLSMEGRKGWVSMMVCVRIRDDHIPHKECRPSTIPRPLGLEDIAKRRADAFCLETQGARAGP